MRSTIVTTWKACQAATVVAVLVARPRPQPRQQQQRLTVLLGSTQTSLQDKEGALAALTVEQGSFRTNLLPQTAQLAHQGSIRILKDSLPVFFATVASSKSNQGLPRARVATRASTWELRAVIHHRVRNAHEVIFKTRLQPRRAFRAVAGNFRRQRVVRHRV